MSIITASTNRPVKFICFLLKIPPQVWADGKQWWLYGPKWVRNHIVKITKVLSINTFIFYYNQHSNIILLFMGQ